jgi:chaperonin GroES
MATIRPLNDQVIVRRIGDEVDAKTAGGLFIPDSAKEKPQEGEVIAVGKGKVLDSGVRVAPDLKPGDRVLFGRYSGSELKVDGEPLLIMRESDVLGVVERAAGATTGKTK